MTVNRVCLDADVYLSCVSHALSTENEEVMGLLIGEITEVDGKRISRISGVMMLCRSDKRMDRVEISPEQLSKAASQAEVLAVSIGRPMRVLGWYHSHPHITVWPSHVDVQTQAMYQTMDDGFIGLIFSVFNEEKTTKLSRIQLTCFQSLNKTTEYDADQCVSVEVPLCVLATPQISRICLESLVELPSVLRREEFEALHKVFPCYSDSEGPTSDVLTTLHNSAVYTKSLCNITEVTSVPLLTILDHRIRNNNYVIGQLREERDKLLQAMKCKTSFALRK